jgi:hypothetical protein
MSVAICHFIRFKTKAGIYQEGYNLQNFFVNQERTRGGITYQFAPYAVTAGAGAKGGDRSDAAIASAADLLAVNRFVEACDQDWLCEISSVLVNPTDLALGNQITRETWVCARPELDTEKSVLRLASPLDAVEAQVPKRTLSSRLVGSIPATGNIAVS